MKEEKFPHTHHSQAGMGRVSEPQRGMQQQVLGRQNGDNSPQRS